MKRLSVIITIMMLTIGFANGQQKTMVSTNRPMVSTNRPMVSTNRPMVSTNRPASVNLTEATDAYRLPDD